VGDRRRVVHNHGKWDVFSAGPDGVTACNNDERDGDQPVQDPGGEQDPVSDTVGDNLAYDGEDDDSKPPADDADEFGPEAILNGDIGDDINNWSASD
jgi:hypothetical protein